jgi:hypothetical protein
LPSENVAQQKNGALLGRKHLQRNQEGERDAFLSADACFG